MLLVYQQAILKHMMNDRTSIGVWDELLNTLRHTVRELHPSVVHTPFDRSALINGTAVFPGGCGLWRGSGCYGPMPHLFPAQPVMFVAHNFDKASGFERSRKNGGEAQGPFWRHLLRILKVADFKPEEGFFTNLLMGLQPLKATGKMPSTPLYLRQCDSFFHEQIRIVRPRLIVGLGDDVHSRLQTLQLPVAYTSIRHPSALTYVSSARRDEWIEAEATKLFRNSRS